MYIRYSYFIHRLRGYVAQRILFCPVTHIFWKITSIFPCRFGKPIYLCNDSVVGSGSQGAGSITYCKHFTEIIPNIKICKIFKYTGIIDSKCLRWLRISLSTIFMGGLLYRIRRGLLFYYYCAGLPEPLNK